MCGRFSLTLRLEALERMFRAKARRKPVLPRYNIAPTQPMLTISNDAPAAIDEMEWGFTVFPQDGGAPRKLVNAKAETLLERAAFSDAFRTRRCLILADGFFEWESHAGKRVPRYFRLRSGEPFAFAGLYDEEAGTRHGVIITTEANAIVSPVHNRMPVMLREPQAWLENGNLKELQSLLVPYSEELMETFTVDPIVNSPENDTAACIAPYTPPQLPLF